MKYIVTECENGKVEIFLFPRAINHDCFAEALKGFRNQTHGNWERLHRRPISAGFVNEEMHCHGHSESLNLSARQEDTNILQESWK